MSEKGYFPPYTLTDKIVNYVSNITEIITKISINQSITNNLKLRKDNRIRPVASNHHYSKYIKS